MQRYSQKIKRVTRRKINYPQVLGNEHTECVLPSPEVTSLIRGGWKKAFDPLWDNKWITACKVRLRRSWGFIPGITSHRGVHRLWGERVRWRPKEEGSKVSEARLLDLTSQQVECGSWVGLGISKGIGVQGHFPGRPFTLSTLSQEGKAPMPLKEQANLSLC